MPDPYVELENETPIQRRDRLMNLNNPDWVPLPNDLAEPEPEPDLSALEVTEGAQAPEEPKVSRARRPSAAGDE